MKGLAIRQARHAVYLPLRKWKWAKSYCSRNPNCLALHVSDANVIIMLVRSNQIDGLHQYFSEQLTNKDRLYYAMRANGYRVFRGEPPKDRFPLPSKVEALSKLFNAGVYRGKEGYYVKP